MATHEELREATSALRTRSVKVEKSIHFAQPLRSWDVYAETIALLLATTGLRLAEIPPMGRDALSYVVSRVLAHSKRQMLPADRDAVIAATQARIAQLDAIIAELNATHPRRKRSQ